MVMQNFFFFGGGGGGKMKLHFGLGENGKYKQSGLPNDSFP